MRTTTKHYDKLVDILGENYIGEKIESPFDFITLASKGIDSHVILNFKNHFKLSRDFTALLLNVSEPTIYRWLRNSKKLQKSHAVQLFELADLFLTGAEVFESSGNFLKWLELPNAALGGLEPKKLLEFPGGVSKVGDLLGRIEHGVYS